MPINGNPCICEESSPCFDHPRFPFSAAATSPGITFNPTATFTTHPFAHPAAGSASLAGIFKRGRPTAVECTARLEILSHERRNHFDVQKI